MNKATVVLFARLLLGIILFWQGYGKVFTWGVDGVYNTGFTSYSDTLLPDFILKATAYFTSYGELTAGVLLLLGLFKTPAYYLVGVILLIVSFGHGMLTPIWDLQHVFFRAALLIFIAYCKDQDRYALDRYLFS